MDATSESPYLRVQAGGVRSASPIDLLALCLTREEKDASQNESAARELLTRFTLSRLNDLSRMDLTLASGLEGLEADKILCALELGRRSALAGQGVPTSITSDQDAYLALKPHLEGQQQEKFVALYLTTKNTIISVRTVHVGTLNSAPVGPREIFREAVRENAAALIVAHNHPSGDPKPSPEDIAITRKLKEVGQILDIPLLDHIVVGHGRFVSLNREGHL